MSTQTSVTDPVARFGELAAEHPRMFWLDGGGSRDWSGRRSLTGWLEHGDVSLTYDAARREVRRHCGTAEEVVGEDVFAVLATELAGDAGDPEVSWVGYFGYAARPDLPALLGEPSQVPDAVWMRTRSPLVFEHPPSDASATSGALPPGAADASAWAEYAEGFARVQEQLRLGNSYEVNLTYRREVESEIDPVGAYLRLRTINPAPYSGYLQHHGTHLLVASPERFASVDRRRWLESKPIKGTTPRGSTSETDRALADALRSDSRFRAENLMIVDLMRNDLSMVCEPGTVSVPALMKVESYTSVHQLVSTIRGRLREGIGTVEALRALFPAGSMTGAPKLRTMQIIEAVERTPRGAYAGAFGWISADGRADLGVVIRALVGSRNRAGGAPYRYTIGTGGGVTVRSEADMEYAETLWKADRLLAALG